MKLGRAFAGLALVCALALLAPAGAGAVDSDLKHTYAFKVEGSNGYSIVALAANERADGRGEIVLFVSRKRESVVYTAPALLTPTSLKANLGALGKVSLEVASSGRTVKKRFRCGEERRTENFEPVRFSGSFEFRGEERYTEAISEAPAEALRIFSRLGCGGGFFSGETTGPNFPGARLRIRSERGDFRLELQANKNRPDKRSHFDVEVREKRGQVSITRSFSTWLGANAFQYDPLLETATLQPPAPFSGRANFYRGLALENRWRGDLTVDLPGRSDLPLTGPGISTTLVPGCWHEGEGNRSC